MLKNKKAIISALVSLFILFLVYIYSKFYKHHCLFVCTTDIIASILYTLSLIVLLISSIAILTSFVRKDSVIHKDIPILLLLGVLLNTPFILFLMIGEVPSELYISIPSLMGALLIVIGIIKRK
jgi:hypothetical protein